MFKASEIIDIAIRLEENAAAVCRQAMERALPKEIKSLLAWMIEEEVRHADWFADLQRRVAGPTPNPIVRAMNREMLGQMIGQQSFSLKQVDFGALGSVDELIDVLVEFEKDTILFYEMLDAFITEAEARSQLQRIIAEEKSHITRLEALRPAG